MIWIVTTKQEEFRLYNESHHNDLKSVIPNIQVIYVETLDCLKSVQTDDLVFVRTKNKEIIDYIHTLNVWVVGETSEVMELDDNKKKLKKVLEKNHILTPKSFKITDDFSPQKKYFVKPLSLGDSIGIDKTSICSNREEIIRKINQLQKYFSSQKNMIEEYIEGEEFSVSIIKTDEKTYAYGVKIIGSNEVLDFDTKINNAEKYEPCNVPQVIATALKVFEVIKAKSYGRVDLRKDTNGNIYVLEINMCAGLSEKGGYLYKCFELNSNISYKNMIELIISTKKKATNYT